MSPSNPSWPIRARSSFQAPQIQIGRVDFITLFIIVLQLTTREENDDFLREMKLVLQVTAEPQSTEKLNVLLFGVKESAARVRSSCLRRDWRKAELLCFNTEIEETVICKKTNLLSPKLSRVLTLSWTANVLSPYGNNPRQDSLIFLVLMAWTFSLYPALLFLEFGENVREKKKIKSKVSRKHRTAEHSSGEKRCGRHKLCVWLRKVWVFSKSQEIFISVSIHEDQALNRSEGTVCTPHT